MPSTFMTKMCARKTIFIAKECLKEFVIIFFLFLPIQCEQIWRNSTTLAKFRQLFEGLVIVGQIFEPTLANLF